MAPQNDISEVLTHLIRIGKNAQHAPQFQLVFFLRQKPGLEERNVRELVEKGKLTIRFEVDSAVLRAQGYHGFFRSVNLNLVDKPQQVTVGSVAGLGEKVDLEFLVQLDKYQCLEVYKALKGEPSGFHLSAELVISTLASGTKVIRYTVPLRKLIDQVLEDSDTGARMRLLRMKYFDNLTDVYLDVEQIASQSGMRNRATNSEQSYNMLKVGDQYMSDKLFLASSVKLSASAMMLHGTKTKLESNQLSYLDLVKFQKEEADQSFPVVSENEKVAWPDRLDKNLYWYLPTFEIEMPVAGVQPESSPFLFTFDRIGATPDGAPVLEGSVQVTILENEPRELQRLQKAKPDARFVPINPAQRSFVLELPYSDANGNQKVSSIPISSVSETVPNRIKLTFRLTNEWIRLCYGHFSQENFLRTTQAKIRIDTVFNGYSRIKPDKYNLLSGVQTSGISVLKPDNSIKFNSVALDIRRRKLVFPDGEYYFKDATEKTRDLDRTVVRPMAVTNLKLQATTLALTPSVNTFKLEEQLDEKKHSLQSFGRSVSLPIRFKCQEFGAYYQENDPDNGSMPIGCHEPYLLGTIRLQFYSEIKTLATAHYRVFQSNQMPGKFFVLPKAYRISRFLPSDPVKAFRPCLYVYTTLDQSENFGRSEGIISATLEPDIPPVAMATLRSQLKNHTPRPPEIAFPGEIDAEATFSWSLPNGTAVNCQMFGKSIQLTISTNIFSLMNLISMIQTTGLTGEIALQLPDETSLQSSLFFRLDQVIGPFEHGPVLIEERSGRLILTNKIEIPVHILKVLKRNSPEASWTSVEMNRTLPALESHTEMTTESFSEYLLEYAVEQRPVTLDEIRTYMDDVSCQIVFIASVNFNDQHIQSILVEFGLAANPGYTQSTNLTAANLVAEEVILMPITQFLETRVIRYRTVTHFDNGRLPWSSSWQEWAITQNGNTINLTSSQVSPP